MAFPSFLLTYGGLLALEISLLKVHDDLVRS